MIDVLPIPLDDPGLAPNDSLPPPTEPADFPSLDGLREAPSLRLVRGSIIVYVRLP